jgi:hypothetical protein
MPKSNCVELANSLKSIEIRQNRHQNVREFTRKAEAVAKRSSALKAQTFTMASEQELRTVLSPLLSRKERAIWITENSYVRLRDGHRYRTEDRHER